MTIIFLLNLYCDSLLYGMQRQFALTTEPRKGLEDYEPEMNTLVTTSLQAEKLSNSTFITYRKQLYVGCLLLSALCKTHFQSHQGNDCHCEGMTSGNASLPHLSQQTAASSSLDACAHLNGSEQHGDE